MTNPTWALLKLAFRYFSRGFERIVFMILGAEIAFLICYLFWSVTLYQTYIPMLPEGYTTGAMTLAGAMTIAGVTAVVDTIYILLIAAAFGLIIGYIRHYLVILSYYDEKEYECYIKFRAPKIPDFLMGFTLWKEAEQNRLMAIEECRKKIAEIKQIQ
jgi:hypothetical protein